MSNLPRVKPVIKAREEYKDRLSYLNTQKICGFCNLDSSFIIKEYEHWIWVFSEFPYWKYNTIIVSKKHKMKYAELSDEEMHELRDIFIEVEHTYLRAGITNDTEAGWGMDILWRQRVHTSGYETRSHIHIHLCPNQEGLFTDILDPEVHMYDTKLILDNIS